MSGLPRYVLVAVTAAVMIYAIGLLYHVQESGDLGIHCLFSDSAPRAESPQSLGPEVRWVDRDLKVVGPGPQLGDQLLRVAGEAVPTYLHFKRRVARLGDTELPPDSAAAEAVADLADLARIDADKGPALVALGDDRWARVDFVRHVPSDDGQIEAQPLSAWLQLKPVPSRFLVLSLTWFLLTMIVLGIAGLVVVQRPRDGSAIMFFLLCAVTIVTFLGAFHWSDLVGTRLLVYPFVLCTLLVPPTTLHFYLLFPRPSRVLRSWPRTAVAAIYALPAVWVGLMFTALIAIGALFGRSAAPEGLSVWLHRFILLVYGYLGVGVAIFALGHMFLVYRFVSSRSQVERSQLVWMLAAVVPAIFLAAYLLVTAAVDRARFAFGTDTRLILYLTSVLFMLAYAISMARYKLFEVGQALNRGLVYLAISLVATTVFCILVGVATAVVGMYAFRLENALAAGLTAMLVVVVLGSVRDRVQRVLDRRFLKERYQLNQAMQRLSEAVDRLVDPSQVAGQLLESARRAVGTRRGLVYLRDELSGDFCLAARSAWPGATERIDPLAPLPEALLSGGVVVNRVGLGVFPTTAQLQLREIEGELALGLEQDARLVGLVVLGARGDLQPYSEDDCNFLVALSKTTALALHNTEGRRTINALKKKLEAQVTKIAEQQQRIRFLQGELLGAEAATDGQSPTANAADAPPRPFDHAIRGSSPAVKRLLAEAAKVARSNTSVLIRGESGTGKELLARAIHENSSRAEGPFIAVHCAALSPSLLESELFGHVKGAFTGADRDRIGRFELADRGTLFLDEIGDVSFETQTKLLRVLQERTFERVGGMETLRVDVRLIAATHQNLEDLIEAGRFRQDLFYRLDVISVHCPPLRERREDIFELALYFLKGYAQQAGKSIVRIDDDALEALAAAHWPGNIRQLQNAMQRAVVLAERDTITLADLPPEVAERPKAMAASRAGTGRRGTPRGTARRSGDGTITLATDLGELEQHRITEALQQAGGNKAEAARRLGIPRSTLLYKLRRLGLDEFAGPLDRRFVPRR